MSTLGTDELEIAPLKSLFQFAALIRECRLMPLWTLGGKGYVLFVRHKKFILAYIIERYALRVAPAVSQEELLKHFQDGSEFDESRLARLRQMKTRIDVLCDPTWGRSANC